MGTGEGKSAGNTCSLALLPVSMGWGRGEILVWKMEAVGSFCRWDNCGQRREIRLLISVSVLACFCLTDVLTLEPA